MATEYVAHHLDQVGSTQDEARARFSDRPQLVTATNQADGRGRSGSSWMNAPRALAASVALSVTWPEATIPVLTLMAGMAARQVLDDDLLLKWPNDLVTATGEKVAGILAERSDDVVVVGLGANLYWPDPPAGMVAIWATDPGPDAPREIAEQWTDVLLAAVAVGPGGWDRSAYRLRCVTLGADVIWEGGDGGKAVDIDESGGLVVESSQGRVVLRSGQVSDVRRATVEEKGDW